jgi:imidazolonepropionase-like amidohydrolase
MGRSIERGAPERPLLRLVVFTGITALLAGPSLFSSQDKMLAIKGGRIHTITKGIIENGVILLRQDIIEDIGSGIEIPAGAEVLDFSGKFIMPGIVSPDSYLGIPTPTEEESIEAARAGPVAKNLSYYPVLYSIYPEHPDYRLALMHGFTTIAVSPLQAGIAGLGAVIKPGGEKLRDILVKDRVFLKINVYLNTPSWDMIKGALEEAQKKLEEKRKKEEEQKKKEPEKKGQDKEEGKLEEKEEVEISETAKIFIEVVEGRLPLLAECSTPSAISHFVALISAYPKIKVLVRGGWETFRAGSLLKEKRFPVILTPEIRKILRWSRADTTNTVLKCQALGLKIAFQASGGISDQIHLFDYLNQLYLYGVKKDVLLKGVTIVPAEILGIDRLVGSLEKGKRADLIVFNDDPLEHVPVIEKVISGGKIVR